MSRHPDTKLERLGASLLGRVCSPDEIVELARMGDLVTRAPGEVIHREADPNLWSYLVVTGDVGVSHRGLPVAVSSAGSLLLPSRLCRVGSPAALTALDDVEVLVFSHRMVGPAVERVPALSASRARRAAPVSAN
jgi:hypothetical protein